MANSQGAANGGIVGPDNNVEIGRFTRFTAPGTYTTGGCTSVDLLVVGGGAGGSAGGGGAGGVRLISSHPIPSSPIPVTVGSGGNGVPSWPCCTSSDGTASNFAAPSPIAATGGGGSSGNNINADGRPGGSGGGGGGSFYNRSGGSGNAGSYSPPEGNPGGQSGGDASTWSGGGGGGGACGAGSNSSPGSSMPGGDGKDASPIFGTFPQPYYPAYPSDYEGSGHFFGGGGGGLPNQPSSYSAGGDGGGGGTQYPSACNRGRVGLDGHGGGGGMGSVFPGGDGIVIVKEPNFKKASGVWTLQEQFDLKKAGTWTG